MKPKHEEAAKILLSMLERWQVGQLPDVMLVEGIRSAERLFRDAEPRVRLDGIFREEKA